MIRQVYIRGMHSLARVLRLIGVKPVIERLGTRSRTWLWIDSLFAIYEPESSLRLGLPWWCFAAIDAVEEHLERCDAPQVFEWGSGASTLWLSSRCAHVTSVEHDPNWAAELASDLPSNAELLHVPPAAVATPTVGSNKPGFDHLDFSEYVRAIELSETKYDLIVVDGRARNACFDAAVSRLAPDGRILVDNVERSRYRSFIKTTPGIEVAWLRGRTPALPYPTSAALVQVQASS